MAQMRRWVPGLFLISLLWLLAAWFETRPVERDIASRAATAVQTLPLDKGQITVDGRDVAVAGQAFSDQDQAKITANEEKVYGVRQARNDTTLIPEAKPYAWSATREGDKLTLSGAAPQPDVRAKLDREARGLVGGTVTDQMSYARGAAPGFDSAALLALSQLGNLSEGKVSVTDGKISVTGTAKDAAAKGAVDAALSKLPQGFSLAENGVKPPPVYSFNIFKDGSSQTVTLNGTIPDESSRQALVDHAKRTFFSDKIVDNLKVAAGAPGGFTDAAKALFVQMGRLETGTASLTGTSVDIKGNALYSRAADNIRTELSNRLPQGFDVKTSLNVKAPLSAVSAPECQRLLSGLLSKGKILFHTGQASIDQVSTGLLDNLVAASSRCPSSQIEVAGYTDSTGNDEANLDLSKRRAQSVVSYLVGAGFSPARLTAVGYGKANPVASNDTEEGREQNRRIEFVVK